MSKPIHVDGELHKAVKMIATEREAPMKEIVEELLRADEDIADREQMLRDTGEEAEAEPVEA